MVVHSSTHIYRRMYRKRYACGYKVFARRGDERREERMEEDPCHSVIGERTVPYRAVPCCIVSLCIVSSSTCKILSLPVLWFVFLFLINSPNNEIFVVLHIGNIGLNGKQLFQDRDDFRSCDEYIHLHFLTRYLVSFSQ